MEAKQYISKPNHDRKSVNAECYKEKQSRGCSSGAGSNVAPF